MWSERELRHKITEAMKTPHPKGHGHKLRQTSYSRSWVSGPVPAGKPSPAAKQKPASYDLSDFTELPDPVEDGARFLLKTCFEQGEGVRIVNAKLGEDGGEVPDGAGPCLSREEWLRKLDAGKGNPNAIFSSSKKTGIYICINPLKIGGSKDADVTAFRHALIEFDKDLSPEEQYNLYQKSRLPCSAVIFSGGKSVHAWVKLNAVDRQDYDEKVKLLYSHFESAGYKIDVKNKNPSRLSRLPNCIRFDGRQELLATNCGCESFSEWMGEVQQESIGTVTTVAELLDFKADEDDNSILGNRWICRGGSGLIIGPSGVGKSSLVLQLCVLWSIGRPAFGIACRKPLKIVVIQAENDKGDLAEMLQGVYAGVDSFSDDDDARFHSNLIFIRDTSHTGLEFANSCRRVIDKHKPDLLVLDPLLSFIGADISRQEVCSQFLRNWMNPIADATGVAWLFVHHTGKPSNDPKSKKHWQSSDYGYAGIGSSELTNWARAIIILEQAGQGVFRLRFPKRGKRAGAVNLDESPTELLWMRHAEKGIFWKQIEEPPRTDTEGEKEKKLTIGEQIAEQLNTSSFLSACPKDGEGLREIVRRLSDWLQSKECKPKLKKLPSPGTLRDAIACMLANDKLQCINKAYMKGPNA